MGQCNSLKKNHKHTRSDPKFNKPKREKIIEPDSQYEIVINSASKQNSGSPKSSSFNSADEFLSELQEKKSKVNQSKKSASLNRHAKQGASNIHSRFLHDKKTFWKHTSNKMNLVKAQSQDVNIKECLNEEKAESAHIFIELPPEPVQSQSLKVQNESPEDYYKNESVLDKPRKNSFQKKSIKNQRIPNDLNNLMIPMYSSIPSIEINMIYDYSYEGRISLGFSFSSLNNSLQDTGHTKILKSINSQGLESFNMTQAFNLENSKVLMLNLPYHINTLAPVDLKFKIIKFKNFDIFHRDPENEEKISESQNLFGKIIEKFPTRWTDGLVPYSIDKRLMFEVNSYNETVYNVIMSCIEIIEKKTVIRFISNKQNHKDYLNFSLGKSNSSSIGRHPGKNLVFLTGKAVKADVLHQIMHSLGFVHMHQKLNKEDFVYLNREQIPGSSFLEEGCNICIKGLEFGPFDKDSVLMFPGCEQMISYRILGDSNDCLSKLDCLKINFFYDDKNLEKTSEKVIKTLKKIYRKAEPKINEINS